MPESAQQPAEASFQIRPTLKPAMFAFFVAVAIVAISYWAYFRFVPDYPAWVPMISFLALIPPVLAWLDSKRALLSFDGRDLRLQSGIFSKTSRSVDVRMVQSARAERSLLQRLWNVGTLIIETGSADARLEIRDIDSPARRARQIQAAAEAAKRPEST